ncbi:MAG: hypothetical protein JXB49_09460 [Bacteroidales bacterium]|nr:hypothetical protein [Bacteroidales bacterium]
MKPIFYTLIPISMAFISCLKDDIEYIDNIKPNVINGTEIVNGKYFSERDVDLDENGYYDTTFYEFLGYDSVISRQTTENGVEELHGNWERIIDTNMTITFMTGDSIYKIEIYNNVFCVQNYEETYLLISPVRQVLGDLNSLVGSYYAFLSYEYSVDTYDDVIAEYQIDIVRNGDISVTTLVSINGDFDAYTNYGHINGSDIKDQNYQFISYGGKYYLWGLFAGKYQKIE